MRLHKPFKILAAAILMTTFAQLSPSVSSQQSQTPVVQKPSDDSQASAEAKEKLRKLAAQQKTFQVGYSPAMERKLAELTGIEIPKNETKKARNIRAEAQRVLAQQQERNRRFENEHPEVRFVDDSPLARIRRKIEKDRPGLQTPSDLRELIPLLPALDWRDYSVAAALVKDQGKCNSCWAFSALAAFESSLQYQYGKTYVTRTVTEKSSLLPVIPAVWYVNLSEQQLLNCVSKKQGNCKGGWHGSAFSFIVTFGADAASEDYTAQKGACEQRSGAYKALAWDYVNYPPDKTPSVEQLKLALLEHGPLVALVHVDDAFQAYKSGVFNERNPDGVNHAVLLTGWDDDKHAWRIQNSWGEQWGEGGFMWIDWESNKIGQYAAWIDAPISYFDKPLSAEPEKRKAK